MASDGHGEETHQLTVGAYLLVMGVGVMVFLARMPLTLRGVAFGGLKIIALAVVMGAVTIGSIIAQRKWFA